VFAVFHRGFQSAPDELVGLMDTIVESSVEGTDAGVSMHSAKSNRRACCRNAQTRPGDIQVGVSPSGGASFTSCLPRRHRGSYCRSLCCFGARSPFMLNVVPGQPQAGAGDGNAHHQGLFRGRVLHAVCPNHTQACVHSRLCNTTCRLTRLMYMA